MNAAFFADYKKRTQGECFHFTQYNPFYPSCIQEDEEKFVARQKLAIE